MQQLIKSLYNLPPRLVIKEIKRKLFPSLDNVYRLQDVIDSPKHMKAQRLFDMVNRYEAIIGRHSRWKSLDFTEKHVLELGCGPLLGLGPLAVFLGCESYMCIEPMYNADVMNSKIIKEKYFLRLFKDLLALYGQNYDFDKFMEDINKKVKVHKDNLLIAPVKGPFDIVFSNSCLEHIFPLGDTLQKLRALTDKTTRFMHLIDFGNHRNTRNPFEGIYSHRPDEYFGKYGKHINLHRAPDVLSFFHEAGIEVALTPYYYYREFYQEKINSYWMGKYSEDALFLKVGLFISP